MSTVRLASVNGLSCAFMSWMKANRGVQRALHNLSHHYVINIETELSPVHYLCVVSWLDLMQSRLTIKSRFCRIFLIFAKLFRGL